ncbi:hypothetical protein [Enterobacter bugandensis]|uniref:hypothetical protein n=1 Tax=Enterobacter bugandensis TaxID=881260 RepID=UPI002FD619EC
MSHLKYCPGGGLNLRMLHFYLLHSIVHARSLNGTVRHVDNLAVNIAGCQFSEQNIHSRELNDSSAEHDFLFHDDLFSVPEVN